MSKELRALHCKELRVAKAEDGTRTISGVVTYNTPSLDLGGFTEILTPGCFAGSIAGDVLLLRDHIPTLLMGRTKSGTLTLSDSADGLHFTGKLPNTTAAADLAESIDRQDLDGVSFGFVCNDDDWVVTPDGNVIRNVIEAELLEISPCSFAAYPANTVSVRSCPQDMKAKLTVPAELRTAESASDDCTCQCQSCLDGDCANCSDDPCDCDGCTCNEYRCMVMKLRLANLM
jgi:hypothetical protein